MIKLSEKKINGVKVEEGNIYCAGVYAFKTKDSDEIIYVGSALEINNAFSRHLHNLKNNKYASTNKLELQEEYNNNNLVFCVIKKSVFSKRLKYMSKEDKINIQKELSVLEQFYINLYKDTVCNKQKTVHKRLSSVTKKENRRRSQVKKGENNCNCKYKEEMIANIIYLKENNYKRKDIKKLIDKNYGVDINEDYISRFGKDRWVDVKAKKPNFNISIA